MKFEDWLERTFGWMRKVPEPFKSMLVTILLIPFLTTWGVYSFYLYFKRRNNGRVN